MKLTGPPSWFFELQRACRRHRQLILIVMPPNFEPTTPIEAYKAIIDQIVEATSGVGEKLLREEGIFSRAPAAKIENAFVKSLTAEQRELLAEMIRSERISAIGTVLSNLTWWLLCRDVGLTFRGQPMPFELSGEGIHGDYIGRLDDWEWPAEEIGGSAEA
jgi:uncharacterized protein DUF6547